MTKNFLTVKDFAEYTGFSKSHIYKLTNKKKIAFYKPTGKMNFFKKSDIDEFLSSNRIMSDTEIKQETSKFLLNKKKIK